MSLTCTKTKENSSALENSATFRSDIPNIEHTQNSLACEFQNPTSAECILTKQAGRPIRLKFMQTLIVK
jgi:hypothetical protein